MSFTVKFETDNACFAENQRKEIAVTLVRLANKLHKSSDEVLEDTITIVDYNGNKIGTAVYTENEE